MRIFHTLQELAACVGQPVAVSDLERARHGPFKAPIAHGFLTLSLLPTFFASALHVEQVSMGVNYGLNKVRFTAPVPVGSRLRAHVLLQDCTLLDAGGMQLTWDVSVECEGTAKPVCIAQSLARYYP